MVPDMKSVDPSSVRVAVLAGGVSHEREVSLSSGAQVQAALSSAGFDNELIDTQDPRAALLRLMDGGFDVAFIALHGRGGEDGSIQGVCETLGIPYTGSGILASATAIDKSRSKVIYRHHGIPVAASVTLRRGVPYSIDDVVVAVGEKCAVKPIGDGSSVGMSIVHRSSELPDAIERAFATGEDVLVESFVPGTEVTAAVLGNDDPEALPLIEIVPHAEFYNYEVKYSASGADHIVPARLAPEVYAKVQQYAVAAHRALGCRGMSRSDFIVDPDRGPFILETNTVPGMTETSLLPDAARHAGYDFPALCAAIVALALERRP